MESKELIKGSLLSVGVFLINAGIALVWNPDRIWPGVIVIAFGVASIFARELLKRRF